MVLTAGFLPDPGPRTSIFHPGSVLRDLDAAFAGMLTSIRQKLPDTEFGFQFYLKQKMKATKAYAGQRVPDKGLRGFLFR